LSEYYSSLLVTPYNRKNSLKDLKSLFNFDVIIIENLRRLSNPDCPNLSVTWLPEDFKSMDCIKICLEDDFHQHKNHPFYNCGIQYIFHRHKNTYLLAEKLLPKLKHFWLPFSVDNTVFHPTHNFRLNKLCFVGHDAKRTNIYTTLQKNNFLKIYNPTYEKSYLALLQTYVGYANHSSPLYNIDNAKAFEIIASGGILFTNECKNGFKELFGENTYMTYTPKNLITQATRLLTDKQLQLVYIKNGLKVIAEKHTHQIRAQQLLSLIKSL